MKKTVHPVVAVIVIVVVVAIVGVAIYMVAGRPPVNPVPTKPMTRIQEEMLEEKPAATQAPAKPPAPAEQQPAPPKTP